MATAMKNVEQVVRKVLQLEQGETLEAIQELSTLLTEEIIPRLTNGSDSGVDVDEEPEEAEEGPVSMSAIDGGRTAKRGPKPSPGGPDDTDESDEPAGAVPESVMEAFTEAYQALSTDQASALAALFTAIDSELEERNEGSRATS